MQRRTFFTVTAASTATLAMPVMAGAALAEDDTDHDSTVDLAEAKRAATETFNKLDGDKDGTLDLKELGGRLSRKELAAADGDHDKTLDKDEYLALVEQRFKAADADGDGSVSAAEFGTPAGRGLLRLLN